MNKDKKDRITLVTFAALAVIVLLAVSLNGKYVDDNIQPSTSEIIDISDTAPAHIPADTDSLEITNQRKWRIFIALCEVESGGDTSAVSKDGKYVGPAQIGISMMTFANNIIGEKLYIPDDRYTWAGSYGIFITVMDSVNPSYDISRVCSIWNKGAGRWYYNDVMSVYNAICEEEQL